MLIVLNFPRGFSGKEEFARDLIKDVKGTFSIVFPKTLLEYVTLIKRYRPRKTTHLILLNSHYDFLRTETEGAWRSAEYLLQTRGGEVWGEPPVRDSMTYAGSFDDTKSVLTRAVYNGHRSLLFDSIARNYIGRTQSDPHTAIVGFRPTAPHKVPKLSEFLLSGLPSEWWKGVAFLDSSFPGQLERMLYLLEDTNIVALGDAAHQKLVDLNIEHGSVVEVSKAHRLGIKDPRSSLSYGISIRNAASTQTDNRGGDI